MSIFLGFIVGLGIFFLGFVTGRRQGRLDEKLDLLKTYCNGPEPYAVGYERVKEKWRKIYEEQS